MLVPLSTFINRRTVILTLKYSRNKAKKIVLGAKEYSFKTLSLIINPNVDEERFLLDIKDGNKAVLKQSLKGNIKLKINDDISLTGYAESADIGDSYIWSEFERFYNGSLQKYERYIPIIFENLED